MGTQILQRAINAIVGISEKRHVGVVFGEHNTEVWAGHVYVHRMQLSLNMKDAIWIYIDHFFSFSVYFKFCDYKCRSGAPKINFSSKD